MELRERSSERAGGRCDVSGRRGGAARAAVDSRVCFQRENAQTIRSETMTNYYFVLVLLEHLVHLYAHVSSWQLLPEPLESNEPEVLK